ncbi:MAG: hypothetical protein ACUZ8I_01250 [Candidatus Scalindua sp.]
MFNMNNNTNNEVELSAPMLTEAVEMIAAFSNDLMVVAEAITQSCNQVENMDQAHKEVFVCRTDALKRLALTYKSRSVRFKAVVQKLVEGAAGDDAFCRNRDLI